MVEMIRRTTTIEDLIERCPTCVKLLVERRLPCLVCGDPAWGTLQNLARDHGYSEGQIDELLAALNASLSGEPFDG